MSGDTLDPVRRLRVLAAAHPGCAIVEAVLDAPFERVWAVAGDLEGGVPRFENTVASARVLWRDGDRLMVQTRGALGMPMRFRAVLRPGWCWMQAGPVLVGMAAAPEGGRTRFAHLEGVRHPAGRLIGWLLRRKMRGELARIERLAKEREAGSPG